MIFGCSSEFQKLAAVALYCPGPEIDRCPDPARILHLAPIDQSGLFREFDAIRRTFQSLGVDVIVVDDRPMGCSRNYIYNMMYCRDLLFMTPAGAIIASMAHPVRREEVLYLRRTLDSCQIPVLGSVTGAGRFEGADALWLNERLVAVGVGNRTNAEGGYQVQAMLAGQGVDTLLFPSSQSTTQHLLGSVQIVDKDLALVRDRIIDPQCLELLKAHGFTLVAIPENHEVRARQAMNIVTVAPRTVIMPAGCAETRRLFTKAGLTIAAEIDITQLILGAGGLACATGILARQDAALIT